MGTPVVFDYTKWAALFPELASVPEQQVTGYFTIAGYFCDNSGSGPVPGGAPYYQLDTFLNYITAFLTKLYATINGVAPSPLVGRISQAAEGSVSVAAELNANPSAALAFWSQNEYGLTYWTMSQQFRTGFYVPPPCGPAYNAVFANGPGYLSPWPSSPEFG